MIARLLKDDDERLDQISDYEVQTINQTGEIIDTNWYKDTTFNKVFDEIEKKHIKGIEVSVLDYGDELQAVVTVHAKSVKHYYKVLIA